MIRHAASFLLSLIVLLVLGSSGCATTAKITTADVPRMPIDELNARLGDTSLVVIDVRADGDWEAGTAKIKGATREKSEGVSAWASNYAKDKTIVLYCA